MAPPARVHPHDARADRTTGRIDRDGARPLAGYRDGYHLSRIDLSAGQAPPDGVTDDLPPLSGVLLGPAPRKPLRLHRDVVLPGHQAGDRDKTYFGPTGAEVDRQHKASVPRIGRGHAGGNDCWVSIMSAMTALMNSAASSVMPPITPP